MSSTEAVNTKFYSLWLDLARNRTRVIRFSSRRSIHSTTDWFYSPSCLGQETAKGPLRPAVSHIRWRLYTITFYDWTSRSEAVNTKTLTQPRIKPKPESFFNIADVLFTRTLIEIYCTVAYVSYTRVLQSSYSILRYLRSSLLTTLNLLGSSAQRTLNTIPQVRAVTIRGVQQNSGGVQYTRDCHATATEKLSNIFQDWAQEFVGEAESNWFVIATSLLQNTEMAEIISIWPVLLRL